MMRRRGMGGRVRRVSGRRAAAKLVQRTGIDGHLGRRGQRGKQQNCQREKAPIHVLTIAET